MHSYQMSDSKVDVFQLQDLKGAQVGCQENFSASEQNTDLIRLLTGRKLLLWDFDGTYCDSEPIHFRAYAEVFAQFGHTVLEDEYYVRFTQGEDGAADECAAYNLQVDPHEIKRLKSHVFRRRIEGAEAQLFPQMAAIVRAMCSNGFRWMVVSNSLAEDVSLVLNQHAQTHPLPECVIGPSPGLRKKPEPDLFLRALSVSGCMPSEALVIEDTEKGLIAAQAAGISALWIETRYNQSLFPRTACAARASHEHLAQALEAMSRSKL
jgi:beta-phosphoglucomutase